MISRDLMEKMSTNDSISENILLNDHKHENIQVQLAIVHLKGHTLQWHMVWTKFHNCFLVS